MMCDDAYPPPSLPSQIHGYVPYAGALAASAASSTTSLWTDTSSQSSDEASVSAHSSDAESCDSDCHTIATKPTILRANVHTSADSLPLEARRHPRRTSVGSRTACPPTLVRQSDRKVNFVDSLVDSSTQIVEAIWPLSSMVCRSDMGSKTVLPLRTFIQETLRRSRTSYSTLQVALYYLVLIKPYVTKLNFTKEHSDDKQSQRALQCGRRMFLAALILASKYLQDRNYSARAWSKISGLNTQEINQNEISFLAAVTYKLHVTDEIFQKWTEIVLKYTPPPSPPSPEGVSPIIAAQRYEWKQLILQLDPDLSNIEDLVGRVSPTSPAKQNDLWPLSPRSILNAPQEEAHHTRAGGSGDTTPQPSVNLPAVLEPSMSGVYTPNRLAPSLGALPTPRLTPQLSSFSTSAASASSQLIGKGNGMSLAMAQASTVSNNQYMDRCPVSITSSPQFYCPVRRSSLATSVSTASSPESMVSDASQSSRSSFSSASSIASATLSHRLNVPSRFRCSKPCNERLSVKPSVPCVPEDFDEQYHSSSSPDSYSGSVGKRHDISLETPLARRERELELCRDASNAARALQDLHNYGCDGIKAGYKRNRTSSIDDALQDNVREILADRLASSTKRLCCSSEAVQDCHNVPSLRSRGVWDAILN